MSLPLEQQVCSLQLSKKLKELGVGQDSYFWWPTIKVTDKPQKPCLALASHEPWTEWTSAFTVAELGEMLPSYIKFFKKTNSEWRVYLSKKSVGGDQNKYGKSYGAIYEANARAKMLIHLIERGIVKVKK